MKCRLYTDGRSTVASSSTERRPLTCACPAIVLGLTVLFVGTTTTHAQEPAAEQTGPSPTGQHDAPSTRTAEFIGPVGSVFLPGVGQVLQRDWLGGSIYQGMFVAGWTASRTALHGRQVSVSDFTTFDGRTEWGVWALQLRTTAGSMSAYDAFQRALPHLQEAGKYAFVRESDTVTSLIRAPGEFHFLKDPATYVPLALVTVVSFARRVAGPTTGREFTPTAAHDVAFSAGLAYDAGVGEEMLFRGYLMPVVRQHLGDRAWTANELQAAAFAAAHGDFSPPGFAAHFGFGLYAGFLVARNRGSLKQAVFNHFIWDLVAVSGSFLTRQRDRTEGQLVLPRIVITF